MLRALLTPSVADSIAKKRSETTKTKKTLGWHSVS